MSELTFSQIKPFIKADLKVRQTPALLGEPGIGKSALIEDLAREFKTKVFTLPVNQLADRADLTGVRMIQDDNGDWGQAFFPHTTVMQAIAYARTNPDETPILFLDEFNRASSDITSAILSFQTLREIGTIKFPDNLRLIVAGNDKGNVTSLDKASLTRFSIYKVKPDIETFLSVQELNPFIEAVLNKHPEDLLAPQLQEIIESDDDDDDSDNTFDLANEFMDDDGFDQSTVPRTITYTSEWLTAMTIDKSGSDDELLSLKTLLSQTSVDDNSDTLKIGLIAHAGRTDFTEHLYDEIKEHYFQSINGATKSQKAVLTKFRPDQDVINALSKSQSVDDVEAITTNLDDTKKQDLLIWLFESKNVTEINNNQAVETAINEVSENVTALDQAHMQGLNVIMANGQSINETSIKHFINSGTPLANLYKDFISATLSL